MTTKKAAKHRLSAEGRAKIAAAQKARHAAKRVEETSDALPSGIEPKASETQFQSSQYEAINPNKQVFGTMQGGALAGGMLGSENPDGGKYATGVGENFTEHPQHALRRISRALDSANDKRDDLLAVLAREYHYHSLRAEELRAELNRNGIEPGK